MTPGASAAPAPKKAFPGVDAHKVGSVGAKDRGFPIGTIHNGRQKVASNPSKWVDLQSGKSYDEHNDQTAHDPHKTASMEDGHKQILDKLKTKLAPEDVKQATALLSDWVEKKMKAKNLQQATNVDSSSTKTLSVPHQTKATKAFDEANKSLQQLSSFLKDAKRRKVSAA